MVPNVVLPPAFVLRLMSSKLQLCNRGYLLPEKSVIPKLRRLACRAERQVISIILAFDRGFWSILPNIFGNDILIKVEIWCVL